jgi:uncharacterized protein (TIGR02246 family)
MHELYVPEDAALAFESAWNAHDMAALGSLFTEDATFVNRFGRMVRGVDQIIALHAPIHETVYSDSTLENELIDAAHIGSDCAFLESPLRRGSPPGRAASGRYVDPRGPHEAG